ncbi:MAG: TonB family protein [Longimicrobiales bacterium]|jgi:TonB family protein|nr:TonB family protein [Longimicrobiales bacterium]|tara:strand:- start:2924 stop:3616 length:693 start_codon:yes stop_codon:yes gene_type:complete
MNAEDSSLMSEEMTISSNTANDLFKKSFDSWFWGSMIVATLVHVALFQFWPTLTAEDVSFSADELEAIELPPEIEIPPPPEAISRPATPVIATATVDEDITIAPTTFEDNPVEDLPPPPTATSVDIASAPTFTPMTVRPEIKNRSAVIQAMERGYPPILRDAGIGGQVLVWFFINEQGRVIDNRIANSSGNAQLDDAALRVASIYEFTPALNRDQVVPVWVQIPITFQVR